MKKYPIDVNLPYYFSLWNDEEFIHQKDINDGWKVFNPVMKIILKQTCSYLTISERFMTKSV